MYKKEYEAFIRLKELKDIVFVDKDAMLNYLHEKVDAVFLYIQLL